MAKKKKDQEQDKVVHEVVTITSKNVHGDTIQETRWSKHGSTWASNRGIMTETAFNDELKRLEKRDDVTITKDTIEL